MVFNYCLYFVFNNGIFYPLTPSGYVDLIVCLCPFCQKGKIWGGEPFDIFCHVMVLFCFINL